MGRLVRDERLSPDLVVSSDAVRARLTAKAVAATAAFSATILLEPRLYHADAAQIVDVLRAVADEDVTTVMVVAHNPGLEDLVARLTPTSELLPTAALAHITLPIDRWSDLRTTTRGTLAAMWRPKEL
jgi:phosphohistidine phosphatase